DAEALLRTGFAVIVGLDEPVALQPLQGRVHLADVERPDLARPRLELRPQLKTVLGAFAQQRQQRVADAHGVIQLDIMLGMILSICGAVYGLARAEGLEFQAPSGQPTTQTLLPARSARTHHPVALESTTIRPPAATADATRCSACSRATETSTCMACRKGLAGSSSCIHTVDPCPRGSTALSSASSAYPR